MKRRLSPMNMGGFRLGFVALALLLCGTGFFASTAEAQNSVGAGLVLNSSSSFWRVFYVIRPPVVRDGTDVKKLPSMTEDTAAPAGEWMQPEFDDGMWTRILGKPFIPRGGNSGSKENESGICDIDGSSPALAMICLRGRFGVNDPAGVNLKLSLRYRGGVIVYVNGSEVGRANMPKGASGPDALAEDYPKEAFLKADGSPEIAPSRRPNDTTLQTAVAARTRTAEIPIPSKALRKGGNVLAIELHRAAYLPGVSEWIAGKKMYGQQYDFLWATCGLNDLALKSASPGVIPNVSRPRGFQVWNSQPMQPDMDLDYGDAFEPLGPVKLVGPRNGVCSGKVVVGSDQAIKGLKAVITDLAGAKGGGTIPASAIQVRYAMPTGEEPVLEEHYPAVAELLDGLSEAPPATVDVQAKKGAWSFGAVCPVWVTVAIPDKAAPGNYAGKLTISAAGAKSVEVPVEVKVCAWQAPPPGQFHTVLDIMQSPETVAMQYDVPLWSDQHFKLLVKSLERAGYVGSWTLHIPLICRTNLGNEQSMVRWIKKPGGAYKHDFTVLEKYLDLATECMGKPRAVDLVAWDLFLGFQGLEEAPTFLEHNTNLPKGFQSTDIPVSMLDEATGKVTMGTVGRYDEAGKANWKALADQLMVILRKRGLDKSLHLGHSYDLPPTDSFVKFWNDLLPGVHYARYGHYEYETFGKTPLGISDLIVFEWAPGWSVKPEYGWRGRKNQTIHLPWIRLRSDRNVSGGYWKSDPRVTVPVSIFRTLGEYCIQSTFQGFGRMGLDYWPVLSNENGLKNTLTIQGRYPTSSWRQSDEMIMAIVPPGPEGALSSSKLEMMREGLQDTEARIFLESVLTDPAKKARLSGALAAKAQQVLDARVRAMQLNVDRPAITGFIDERTLPPRLTGFSEGGMYLVQRSAMFQQWFMESGWQQRSGDIFNVAGEIAATGVK